MDQSEHHHRLASTAADWCFLLHGWPIMPPLLGVYVFTDRLAFAAADWCFRLHGWPITPPLLGVYVFTDRPPRPPPTGVSACTAGLYAAVVGRLRLHRPAASTAADWCFRLHGWPLRRRCWASTSSPTGRLDRRRLVFPPARLAFMPPLLGVYVFTDRPPRPPPTGVSACTAGLYAAVDWASTSSPTGRLVRRRLVLPPARLAFTPPLLGVYVFTDRLAFAAADWCFRLHGWPITPPLLGVYVFTDRPPRPPPTGVSACTAGLYAAVDWASTSSPTGLPSSPPTVVSACTAGLYAAAVGRLRLHRPACLRRRRLVFPPARLAFMPPLLGVYVFTDRPPRPPPTATTTDGHHRLPPPTRVMPPPTGAFIFTTARLHYRFTSSRQHNFVIMVERLHLYYLRNQQTLLLLLHKFCYITNHDVVVNLDISACDAVLFYYNKWLSNIQDFYLDIFNTYLQSSNDYSTTRSYNSRLYVQLFPN
uniref:cysteine dioxygenase n=1 Tax=Oryza sativa subsp. japonica TaxID=39947 RepID=Q7FAH6_ORYSJ|nr:OSJNBa0073L13.3 [Oryza sativa Japonica Group]